ncbi:4395_t:CDS:2 [Diversispora eburnea]|uniref:4395_t:CDS:1 n=1 Tax=Diversispora eburnea TaxID=1213867 RepID=A0A9N8ZZZ1_9GLOM|nr:4395_t:CDS:2 [Diversispora eburnea]
MKSLNLLLVLVTAAFSSFTKVTAPSNWERGNDIKSQTVESHSKNLLLIERQLNCQTGYSLCPSGDTCCQTGQVCCGNALNGECCPAGTICKDQTDWCGTSSSSKLFTASAGYYYASDSQPSSSGTGYYYTSDSQPSSSGTGYYYTSDSQSSSTGRASLKTYLNIPFLTNRDDLDHYMNNININGNSKAKNLYVEDLSTSFIIPYTLSQFGRNFIYKKSSS